MRDFEIINKPVKGSVFAEPQTVGLSEERRRVQYPADNSGGNAYSVAVIGIARCIYVPAGNVHYKHHMVAVVCNDYVARLNVAYAGSAGGVSDPLGAHIIQEAVYVDESVCSIFETAAGWEACG